QVLHLDGDRMLRFRQAVGLPGFARLLRLARTTCGDDAKVPAGLTEVRIRGVTQPVLALFGERSPFLATADYLAANLAYCRNVRAPGAKHRAPEENSELFVGLVSDFLTTARPPAELARPRR